MEINEKAISFKNKVAVVSGACSNIGKKIAIDLASLGCKLIIIDTNKDKLSKLKNEIVLFDKDVLAISCDISNKQQVDELASQVIRKTGKVEILINAESYGLRKSFEESSVDEIEELMKKNYLGNIYITKAFLKTLREQEESYIVNITSNASFLGIPNYSGYCASKSAVLTLSESIHNEFYGSRLNVTCVCLGELNNGLLNDPLFEKDQKSSITPEQVSKEIIKAIRKKQFLVVIPKKYRAILLTKGISPNFVNAQARKKLAE
jgi:short-subunit dehydrogenase